MSDTSQKSCIIFSNIQKGKLGEQIAKEDYERHGFKVIKTGRGSDFIAMKRGNLGKPYVEFVEVKTGKAKPSRKQLLTMRKIRRTCKNYSIYRITDIFLESYIKSRLSSLGEV